MSEEARKQAPAVARNRDAIAEVLAEELPASGLVLEVASGTGEHALHFARRFPQFTWQPSDPDADALRSIAAWRADCPGENLLAPLELDACSSKWLIEAADAVICINMVHISPWKASEGLFAGARRLLGEAAPLILYGPYLENAVETAVSNLQFDRSLRSRNAQWGLRRLEDMDALATRNGFSRTARYAMPANNLTLIYRRA